MSLRSAPPVDHSGIESGKDLTTWGTLKRGIELSPEIRRGIWVTIGLAILSTVGKLLVPFVVQRTTDEGIVAADQGVPPHPRPVGADPEHRTAWVARLACDLGRRHHLDVRPVRRAHVH